MSIIQSIANSWSWVGIEPDEIVGENDFGNLIIILLCGLVEAGKLTWRNSTSVRQ